jgi:hypothetical protein
MTEMFIGGHDGLKSHKGFIQLDVVCGDENRHVLCLGCRTVACAMLVV